MALVYFISDGEYTKIGQSTNLEARMANLQCANARELTILHTIECDDSRYISMLEGKLHKLFKAYHVSGEWFRLDWEKAYAEIFSLESSMVSEIEERNTIARIGRQQWEQKMLQARFDALVDQDLEENYPPMKKFWRPPFDENDNLFGEWRKKSRFHDEESKEPRRFRFDFAENSDKPSRFSFGKASGE